MQIYHFHSLPYHLHLNSRVKSFTKATNHTAISHHKPNMLHFQHLILLLTRFYLVGENLDPCPILRKISISFCFNFAVMYHPKLSKSSKYPV